MSSVESQRLLKAHDIRALGSKVAFNFEDLRQSCDDYMQQTREQAKRIIEQAKADAELIKQQALSQGKQDGLSQGLQNAKEDITQQAGKLASDQTTERFSTVLPAIAKIAKTLEVERDRWLTDWESTAIRLCVAIAEKIVRRKLDINPELGRDLILDVIKQVSGHPEIRVHLNPDDLKSLGDNAKDLIASVASCGNATLHADPEIAAGSCLIETQHGVLDARLETQLERIASELIQQET